MNDGHLTLQPLKQQGILQTAVGISYLNILTTEFVNESDQLK